METVLEKLERCNVLSVELDDEMQYASFSEKCDSHYWVGLCKQEVLELANEIKKLADTMADAPPDPKKKAGTW